jgi:1-aminocyclopropane-1-carboxylate deaminase
MSLLAILDNSCADKRKYIEPCRFDAPGMDQIKLDILRLDTLHPQVSGNKWLKLKPWLLRYATGRYHGILTKGGPWSNHLHACSFACRFLNISLIALVKGSESQPLTPTLKDVKHNGGTLMWANHGSYNKEEVWQKVADNLNYLYIPMGGEGAEGVAGVTEWFNQLDAPAYDYLFCAFGSGTTLLGIGQSTLKCPNFITTDSGTRDAKRLGALQLQLEAEGRKLVAQAAPGRFGKVSAETIALVKQWHNATGIVLDVVYTAPLFQQLLSLAEAGTFAAGSRVLAVHTGGVQGNRSVPQLAKLKNNVKIKGIGNTPN